MDAIECGIVKLPRIPVADNSVNAAVPIYRNLWDHIGKKMPKHGRGKGGKGNPLDLPSELYTALYALYGHYEKTFEEWSRAGIEVPPVFIVVCNNTWRRAGRFQAIVGLAMANRPSPVTRCLLRLISPHRQPPSPGSHAAEEPHNRKCDQKRDTDDDDQPIGVPCVPLTRKRTHRSWWRIFLLPSSAQLGRHAPPLCVWRPFVARRRACLPRLPQPYAGRVPVRELDAGRLKGGANSAQSACARHPLVIF
jgi:hypothetical protein